MKNKAIIIMIKASSVFHTSQKILSVLKNDQTDSLIVKEISPLATVTYFPKGQ